MSERLGLRARPKLERLEDRCTPAAYTVTLATDTNAAGNGVADPMDATKGDMRYCLSQANLNAGADTITISAGVNPVIKKMLPEITDRVTIKGQGMANTSISANNAEPIDYRIFKIKKDVDPVTIEDLTISGGNVTGLGNGGGILNEGRLYLTRVDINNCRADFGGGLSNEATLASTLDQVFIHNNTATVGGGIYVSRGGAGPLGFLITNSTISHNNAANGAGLYNNTTDTTTFRNTGIWNNNATGDGGGIYNGAGSLLIEDSTVLGNNADGKGGGIYSDATTTTLTRVTLSYNTAGGKGGGFYLKAGTLTTNQGIISDNNAAEGTAYYWVTGATYVWNGTMIYGTAVQGPP